MTQIIFSKGDPLPDFSLADETSHICRLTDFRGRNLVLYFYPKDDTSGCTMEALDFFRLLPEFQALKTHILGVSPDSCASHQAFRAKHQFDLQLLSDPSGEMLRAYGVWGQKTLYGRAYEGVLRTTFLIDGEGCLVHQWNNVRVKGHAEEVLKTLQSWGESGSHPVSS